MSEHASKVTANLSGGTQRKLQGAIALFCGGRTLFLDELTSGVDAVARRSMAESIKRVAGGGGGVITSHRMDEVERICDRVAVLVGGRKIVEGTPNELKRSYGGGHLVSVVGASERELCSIEERLGLNRGNARGEDEREYQVREVPLSYVVEGLERRREQGIIRDFGVRVCSLEDVFSKIVGKHAVLKSY